MYCGRVGDSARTLVMTALKAETGLELRSSGATLLSEDGAIDVQMPAVTDSQVQAGSGMIFWMRPKKSEWTAWRAVGPGVRYRDYELGLARFPMPAQQTAGITGPIVGASEIRLRFTLRLEQEQCSHTRSGRANGGKVAKVIVFRDTKPATGALRAWTHLHPHGINLHHMRLPDGAGMDLIDDTNLANEDGTRDTVPAVIHAARVKAEQDEEASGRIHDGALPTPALKRRRGDTSMPGGRQGPTSLSQTLGLLRGVRLASQRTWEVHCRSFKAKVLVLSGGFRVVCSTGFIARVCSKESKDGLILFKIFGECLCGRQSQSGSG
jgi:hypothetical protein